MNSTNRELEEVQRRLARMELLLASVEFDRSFWGRVLRLFSVAAVSFVVVLLSPYVTTVGSALFGMRP
jgi:hypothetical protein